MLIQKIGNNALNNNSQIKFHFTKKWNFVPTYKAIFRIGLKIFINIDQILSE